MHQRINEFSNTPNLFDEMPELKILIGGCLVYIFVWRNRLSWPIRVLTLKKLCWIVVFHFSISHVSGLNELELILYEKSFWVIFVFDWEWLEFWFCSGSKNDRNGELMSVFGREDRWSKMAISVPLLSFCFATCLRIAKLHNFTPQNVIIHSIGSLLLLYLNPSGCPLFCLGPEN